MIIGLTGKKGVGKSTVANLFVKQGFKELSFAYPLKSAAAVLLGIPEKWIQQANSEDKEQLVPGFTFTYRHFLQQLGTEFARNLISENFWVDRMEVAISKHKQSPLIISDIRYDNEAELILNKGGTVIRIDRDSATSDTHTSEQGISKCNYSKIINNNGNLQYLENSIQEILKTITKK